MANHAALIRQLFAGKPVIERGRHHIAFDDGNGQTRFVATIEPLHLRGSEVEIDATWVSDVGAWQWKLAAVDFQAHARSVFNAGSLIEWRHSSGEWVIVDPQSINWVNQDNSRQQIAIKQPVTGQASDATLSFPNAYGTGRHFSYTAHPKRLIKHITIDSLASLPAPTVTGTIQFEAEWTISNSAGVELYIDGVRWARTNNVRVRTANRIEFRNAAQEVLWYADAPTATDANGETVAAQYEVARSGSSYFIRVRVPRAWLLTAAYPVVVDPTFTDGYGGDVETSKDCHIISTDTDRSYNSNILPFNNGGTKSFIESDLSSIAATATCDSATSYFYVDTTVAGTVYLHELNDGNTTWIEPSGFGSNPETGGAPTWDYRQQTGSGAGTAWNGSAGCSTSGAAKNTPSADYVSTALGSFVLDGTEAAGTEKTATLTPAAVEAWFGASNANNGLVILRSVGNTRQMCSSEHATTGYRPKLVVVYTAAGGVSLTPDPVVIPITTPAPALSLALGLAPSAVAVPLVLPAPTLAPTLALSPDPVAVPLALPAPTVSLSLSLTPDPVSIPIVVPTPTLAASYGLSPDPVAVSLVLPAPVVAVGGAPVTLTPDPVAVVLAVPAPALELSLGIAPEPIAVPLALPEPVVSLALELTPEPIAVALLLPAPSVEVQGGPLSLTSEPVAVALSLPEPTLALSLELTPDPVAVPLVVPLPTLGLTLALWPDPLAVVLVLPNPILDTGAGPIALAPEALAIVLVLPVPTVTNLLIGPFKLVVGTVTAAARPVASITEVQPVGALTTGQPEGRIF